MKITKQQIFDIVTDPNMTLPKCPEYLRNRMKILEYLYKDDLEGAIRILRYLNVKLNELYWRSVRGFCFLPFDIMYNGITEGYVEATGERLPAYTLKSDKDTCELYYEQDVKPLVGFTENGQEYLVMGKGRYGQIVYILMCDYPHPNL